MRNCETRRYPQIPLWRRLRRPRDEVLRSAPLGRIGEPKDIGYAVLYLCASSGAFITDAGLVVDGGLTIASR
jgi:NAD(P)-dependent dehydrogenase (short-subunit alcohol dehydrogenase family)